MYGGVEEGGVGDVQRCRFHSLGDDVSFDDTGHRRRGRHPVSILNSSEKKKRKKKVHLDEPLLSPKRSGSTQRPESLRWPSECHSRSVDSEEVLSFSDRSLVPAENQQLLKHLIFGS